MDKNFPGLLRKRAMTNRQYPADGVVRRLRRAQGRRSQETTPSASQGDYAELSSVFRYPGAGRLPELDSGSNPGKILGKLRKK